MGGFKEWAGFGLFSNIILLYYFLVFKHCWPSIISVIGMIILNLINSISMFIVWIQCLFNSYSESEIKSLIIYNDKILTPYDCAIIFITFIVATILFIRREIMKIK